MNKKYQVTLFCKDGKYKPVSAIVDGGLSFAYIQLEGIRKICMKRGWDKNDLKRYGYTLCKVRPYDKEKIEQENKERYERIKEEKYASGEWKRPKGK